MAGLQFLQYVRRERPLQPQSGGAFLFGTPHSYPGKKLRSIMDSYLPKSQLRHVDSENLFEFFSPNNGLQQDVQYSRDTFKLQQLQQIESLRPPNSREEDEEEAEEEYYTENLRARTRNRKSRSYVQIQNDSGEDEDADGEDTKNSRPRTGKRKSRSYVQIQSDSGAEDEYGEDIENPRAKKKKLRSSTRKKNLRSNARNQNADSGQEDEDGDEDFCLRRTHRRTRINGRRKPGKIKNHNTEIDDLLGAICPETVGRLLTEKPKVSNALMIYDALRRKILQQKEMSRRPDLAAGTLMRKAGLYLSLNKNIIGSIPGVEVGDIFYYREELCVVGLHIHTMNGISFITAKNSPFGEPVTVSIVSSGCYEDNEDPGGDSFVYTGQGSRVFDNKDRKMKLGKHKVGDFICDQKLEKGNLALKNSMVHGVEVRVIRKVNLKDFVISGKKEVYVYDGLYQVEESWFNAGKQGCAVFKFQLERVPDQPPVGSWILKRCLQWIQDPRRRENLLICDLSAGKEDVPVFVTNDGDDSVPKEFEYCNKVMYSNTVSMLKAARGCNCRHSCFDNSCSCIRLSGGQISYDSDKYLVRTKNVIYECGKHCGCPENCWNKATQYGLQKNLEVFRTPDQRWAVRSLVPIAAGSFVCEYTGEISTFSDYDSEEEDDDEDGCHVLHVEQNMVQQQINFDHLYAFMKLGGSPSTVTQPSIKYDIIVNAARVGNVSRFIAHDNSSPNLVRQCVLYDHHDTSFPHIMLFAMKHIPPMVELTLDYGTRRSGK